MIGRMGSPAQLIDPKEQSRKPLDLQPPIFDDGAVSRADEALKAMSGSFRQWLDKEVVKLQGARLAAVEAHWSEESMEALHLAAHDLKGLGATYEYPLVTQMSGSLCRLIETSEARAISRLHYGLIEAHVDAVRAAARQEIKTSAHPVGRALLNALETQVESLDLPPR